jgi:hypothetical protein
MVARGHLSYLGFATWLACTCADARLQGTIVPCAFACVPQKAVD